MIKKGNQATTNPAVTMKKVLAALVFDLIEGRLVEPLLLPVSEVESDSKVTMTHPPPETVILSVCLRAILQISAYNTVLTRIGRAMLTTIRMTPTRYVLELFEDTALVKKHMWN